MKKRRLKFSIRPKSGEQGLAHTVIIVERPPQLLDTIYRRINCYYNLEDLLPTRLILSIDDYTLLVSELLYKHRNDVEINKFAELPERVTLGGATMDIIVVTDDRIKEVSPWVGRGAGFEYEASLREKIFG